jgi:hypothetical protein
MKTGKKNEIKEGIIPLWHAGYYDGPLSGFVEYQGQKCFFSMKHEYISRGLSRKIGRTYWIYKVTPEQWQDVEYWHNEFRLHVGWHCDYKKADDQGYYTRTLGTSGASHEYMIEMYYDRHNAHNLKNGNVCLEIEKPENIIGWTTWDVLVGKPWKEWRKNKKEVGNVLVEKEGT